MEREYESVLKEKERKSDEDEVEIQVKDEEKKEEEDEKKNEDMDEDCQFEYPKGVPPSPDLFSNSGTISEL